MAAVHDAASETFCDQQCYYNQLDINVGFSKKQELVLIGQPAS